MDAGYVGILSAELILELDQFQNASISGCGLRPSGEDARDLAGAPQTELVH